MIQGGPNTGFATLTAALDYLKSHPTETVWAMSWDAPSFPPKDEQLNENLVILVLAGAQYETRREPLAWVGYPSVQTTADFKAEKGKPSRLVQAWTGAMHAAAANVGTAGAGIGYAIHDAGNTGPAASQRIGALGETLTGELLEFDFMKQTFNTTALLGDMGAGGALTNVALAIGYANHFGRSVLVAGTQTAEHPTALVVAPPANMRPIDPSKPWFRARGENNAYLPWWGRRHDARVDEEQGYSE